MVYLVTNITDSTPKPLTITIADIPSRVAIELAPGETIDLERFSTRNQILDSKHIKVHLQEARITVDTLGSQPRERIYVDALIGSGIDINVGSVSITEPLEISVDVNGTETAVSGVTVDGDTYIDVNPLLPDEPTIIGIPVPSANFEQSYALPIDSKCFRIAVREGDANLKVAFNPGDTSTSNYMLVRKGISYSEKSVDAGTVTIYFQTDKPGRTVEVVSWAI